MPHFAHDGVDVYYEVHGDGPPVLLIPGLATDCQCWLPVLERLSARFRAITIDNRGSGRTTPMDAPSSIDAMAEDCAALLSALDLPAAGVVGYSMGGFVAQRLALRHPARVAKLVLSATAAVSSRRNNRMFADWARTLADGMEPRQWFRNLFYWVLSERFFDDDAAVENFLQLSVDYPYPQTARALENQVTAIAAFDGMADLPRVAIPALVLAGSEDLIFSPRQCAAFAAALPLAAFSIVEGAGHAIQAEKPDAFLEAVMPFLAGIGRRNDTTALNARPPVTPPHLSPDI